MNFTSTLGIPPSPIVLEENGFRCSSLVGPRDFTPDAFPPTRALRPIIPNNACTLRITAAAGAELAGASSDGTVITRQYFQRINSFHLTELYDPKAFVTHAALLRQGFPHCARFPTAASRRSLDRVSVPVWLATLSGQLTIIALVGHYPTNKLMVRELIPK